MATLRILDTLGSVSHHYFCISVQTKPSFSFIAIYPGELFLQCFLSIFAEMVRLKALLLIMVEPRDLISVQIQEHPTILSAKGRSPPVLVLL
jgi:hypothetical protein